MEPKGNASAETNWKRLVRDRSDIEELADDIGIGTHNMWVDIRSKDFGTGEYDAVEIDVIVRVSEHGECPECDSRSVRVIEA